MLLDILGRLLFISAPVAAVSILYGYCDALRSTIKQMLKQGSLNHKSRTAQRLAWIFTYTIGVCWFSTFTLFPSLVCSLFLLYYLVHDPSYNLSKELDWDFMGTTANYDIKLRKITRWPGRLSFICEAILYLVTVLWYVHDAVSPQSILDKAYTGIRAFFS